MISLVSKGNFKKTERFLKKSLGANYKGILEKYGQMGVDTLRSATPIESGETAQSWSYEIIQNESSISIIWKNSNVNKGVNIAIILQYGHYTRNGGYVNGRDYINPALRPIFDKLADDCWKAITKV